MWDLPRPGLEPASPALAGRFSTTAPPGKPPFMVFDVIFFKQKSKFDLVGGGRRNGVMVVESSPFTQKSRDNSGMNWDFKGFLHNQEG